MATTRELTRDDLERFDGLCEANPSKRVRVYSERGFVARAYKWRCDIEWIERGAAGDVTHGFSGAQRSHGDGPLATINGRRT